MTTSGHFPRALELVQFLSVYCTSLSSQQQNRVSQFQIASFTQISLSDSAPCKICPGSCLTPSALILPTFALLSSLFAVAAVFVMYDLYEARNSTRSSSSGLMQDRLLAAETASAQGRPSRGRKIAVFCIKYIRGLTETISSYVLMPSSFVFVMNVWPTSFMQNDVRGQAMIVALPVITLLLRFLVIRQRVVDLSSSDQKQLCVSSVVSVANAVIFAIFFKQSGYDQQASTFASATLPKYLVLAMLASQLIAQTVIRIKATEASIFDNTDWPWFVENSKPSSSMFSLNELAVYRSSWNLKVSPRQSETQPVVKGSIKRGSRGVAISVLKFLLLNYLSISQMVMVIIGIVSSGATTLVSIETSSVVIGTIPLVTSGTVLLYNVAKFIRFFRKKWIERTEKQAGSRRSDKESFRTLGST